MAARRKVTVKPGQTKTVRNPGGGKTRIKNDPDKIDIQITQPKK